MNPEQSSNPLGSNHKNSFQEFNDEPKVTASRSHNELAPDYLPVHETNYFVKEKQEQNN